MREARTRCWLRALLSLYPVSFRDSMGDDLLETAVHRWGDMKRHAPRLGGLRFWLTEGVRFAVDGVLERLRSVPATLAELPRAWRQVRRAPGHHGIAVLTLALGIGATTTMFTVTDAVVFRPLPYPDAAALYLIHAQLGTLELSSNSLLNVRDLQGSVRSMAWIAAVQDRSPALTDAVAEAERISVLDVTDNYLSGLGGTVQLGRSLTAADYAADAPPAAVISDALWERRWARDPNVLGRSMLLDDAAYTIVGIMRRSFRDPEPIESGAQTHAWLPVRPSAYRHRDAYAFRVVGRLADGVTVDAARAELAAAGAQLSAAHPEANRFGGDNLSFTLHPLRELTLGTARARLLLLLGAVGLLLVLSCANVANLFLARGVTRTAELAVRNALGATRARLAFQLFSESLLTATVAAVAGGVLAYAGVQLFVATAPEGIPRLREVSLDERALAFMILLTILTAALFGSVPALRGAAAAASGTRVTTTRGARRLQSTLLGAEVAIALVLVAGSALLLNSFRHIVRVHPGFDGGDVMVVDVRPPTQASTHAQELLFYATLVERARALPEVERAALVHSAPGMEGGAFMRVRGLTTDAQVAQTTERSVAPALSERNPGDDFIRINPVYGDVFETLDIKLRAGRTFADDPGQGDPLVAVINAAAARLLFPDTQQPIGRQIALGTAGSATPFREIVGIVADVRQRGVMHDAEPQIYLPYGQRDINRMYLVLETRAGASLSGATIRQLVRDVAPNVPVDAIDALSDRYAATAGQARFLTFLLSVFAAVALILAVVGTYATAAHALSRRTRELGIRMALGARTATVFRLIMSHALVVVSAGITVGILLTLPLTRFLESYMFGITARDPVTLAVAALLIGACGVLASLGPGVRATRVEPNSVLRME